MPLFPRYTASLLERSLRDTRVVVLVGARQTGKSTLVRALVPPDCYISFDEAAALAAASHDPDGFVAGLPHPAVLDEVQRVPRLLLSIKSAVDRDETPGRFVLTGSANVLFLPTVAESLAGRMESFTLWPLSQGELSGHRERLIEHLFAGTTPRTSAHEGRAELIERILRGGYPEVVRRSSQARRAAWVGSYVTAVVQRDVRDLASIAHLHDLPRLLGLVAARAPGLVNIADLSRDVGLPVRTVDRYLTLLEHVFLMRRLPAWSRNLGKRLIRAPKLLVNDTALAAGLLGLTAERLARWEETLVGGLLENFVAMELTKQASWSDLAPALYHYRTAQGTEVDLVLEDRTGRVAGVEVKAAASVDASHFRGLRELEQALGDRFARGIVLYTGRTVVPFGERLAAWPVQTLWSN